MTDAKPEFRNLPSVDALATTLHEPGLSRAQIVEIARSAVDLARAQIGEGQDGDAMAIAEALMASSVQRKLRRVINATGVLLHTNLGRAPLSSAAAEAAVTAASHYSNTEFDLSSGERGSRGVHTRELLKLLTGAEDALVVNNNAAAVLLSLAALAADRSVPVSRGELVEIGGSYRLPDVMTTSGARLVEVGTTNKTRRGDFETALQTYDCAMVLKVHQANFEIRGFTASVDIGELASLCQTQGIPVAYDLGSGLLDSGAPWLPSVPPWLGEEPGVRQAVDAGANLVMFSGDKLLGGPQAGIIVGDADLVARLRDHPLRRALRVDASTDAALAATLDSYARGTVASDIPFWRMATTSSAGLVARSSPLAAGIGATVEPGFSIVGAGSAPGARIESPVVRMVGKQSLFSTLLDNALPVVARRDRGDLLIDLRAVEPTDDVHIQGVIQACL
ncbi:MAG TPA: L-seryl-tRNA(Sec) selenium transferase [Acidimicrobiia bacterium]